MSKIEEQAKIKYNQVLDLIEYGKEKYEKVKGKKPFEPLTVQEACLELGFARHGFYAYVNNHPSFAKKYYFIRESRRENMRNLAETNLEKIMSGELAVENKDLGELSLKILKSTDKNYNQKQEIDATYRASLEMSTEEIMAKINELNQ